MQIETFFSVSQQTSFFLMSVVLGAALGVVYDFFRVFRIVFPLAAKTAAVAVQDIIFWLIYGFCIFCYGTIVCRGEIRFYVILGSLVGFVLYILTLGNLVTGIIRTVVTAFYKGLRKVYSFTIEPIVKLLRNICQKASPVFVGSHENKGNTAGSAKKLLKNAAGLLYNKKAKLGSSILNQNVRR